MVCFGLVVNLNHYHIQCRYLQPIIQLFFDFPLKSPLLTLSSANHIVYDVPRLSFF